MSMKLVKNNFNLSSGLKLPILYIEKAIVNDSSIDIKVVFYIRIELDKEPDVILQELSNLNFYIYQVIDGVPNVSDESLTYDEQELTGTNRIDKLINGEQTIFEYSMKITDNSYKYDIFNSTIFSQHKYPISLSIDDFNLSDQIIDDDNQHKILKYAAETSSILEFANGDSVEDNPDTTTNQLFLNADDINLNLSLVTFSTPLLMTGFSLAELLSSSRNAPRLVNLYNSLFSQLSYQEIFKNGELKFTPDKIFTFEDGTIFDDNENVTQAINGSFYALVNMTRDDLLSELRLTIPAVSTIDSDAFNAAINGFKYILEVYGSTEEIIPRLDLFRNTYLDKSTATPMGLWYQTFNQTLMRLNSMIMQNVILRRELVTTPVVIENRTVATGAYVQPEESTYSLETDYLFTNEGSILMSRIGHQDLSELGEEGDFSYEDDYELIENGFFFFDYEKAARTQSVISKVLDLNRLDQLFGLSSLNEYFKLTNVQIVRRGDLGNNIVYNINSVFDDTLESTGPNLIKTSYFVRGGKASISYNYEGTTIYPELILRNMHIPGNDAFNQYRMMTFQFQNIMPSAGSYSNSNRDNDNLTFSLTINDMTKQLVNLIVDSFASYATGPFNEYFEAAQDFCSYNNTAGSFNDFFVEQVEANYIDDLQSAPWVVMPIIYNMHLDLVNGVYDGSLQKITDASIILTKQIAPSTGRLDELSNFNENIQNIIAFYNSETFLNTMEQYSTSEAIEFGGSTINVLERFGLPDFLNVTDPTGILTAFDDDVGTYFIMSSWSSTASVSNYSTTKAVLESLILELANKIRLLERTPVSSGGITTVPYDDQLFDWNDVFVGDATTETWTNYFTNIENSIINEISDADYTYTYVGNSISAAEIISTVEQLGGLIWPNSTSREDGTIAMKALLSDNGFNFS